MAGCENVTIAVTDCARHGSCEVSGQFWRHFDRRRDAMWQNAVAGTVNRIDCGECGRRFGPPEEFLYTDTERNFAIVISPAPLDGQVGPDDFSEVLLAVEARLTSSALLETKALLAAYTDTKIDTASLRLVGIDNVLSFQNENGSMIELPPKTGRKVMAQQDDSRQTLANRRARRRRHIGDRNRAAAKFLAAFSQKGLVNDFVDEIAAVKAAIAQGYFTRDQAYAMARLARKPQAHQFDRAQSFALFEDMTGIELSDELETAKARTGLPVLAALWYAYAQLPDKARRWRGLGLEEVNGFQSEAIGGAFDTGSSAADPDKVLLSFGAIESSLFAPVLRHELAHALHDSNLELIDRWLTDNFGWRVYQLPMDAIGDEAMLTAAVEGWIEQLGGWDVAAPGATTEADKRMLRFKIWQACQPLDAPRPGKTMSRWNDDLAGDPQWFGASLPQQAYVRSPDDWWRHADKWLPLPGNPERVTFMCYQYRQLIVVDSSVVDLVSCGAIPNRYALMSQKEFFAELYTCWHWRRNGAESPRRLVRTQVPAFRDLLGEL